MIYRNRKKLTILGLILTAVFLFYIFEVYVPNLGSATKLEQYVIQSGKGTKGVGDDLKKNNFYSSKDFIDSTKKDWIQEFIFLKDKLKKLDLEGYIFPDTYQVHPDDNIDVLTEKALSNFDKKLTPELKQEITKQKKTIFQIITMASIIEIEASNTEDRKMI